LFIGIYMTFKTNLVIMFNSEGEVPTQITNRLKMLNFFPAQGSIDYTYSWDHTPTIDEILALGNKVSATLKGANVLYNLETSEEN
ncbi:MAG: hypothetical protein COT55_01550, partial [Candidatus Diapherotrites archaeon CG09_land_8_20_14_0_10_32_12]